MDLLALNIGSSSKKYTLKTSAGVVYHKSAAKRHEGYFWESRDGVRAPMSEEQFSEALIYFLEEVYREEGRAINPKQMRAAIRVVMPGTYYTEHRVVDKAFVERLTSDRVRDPVHADPLLAELQRIQKTYPDLPVHAISDSAFHTTMPEVARRVTLPEELCRTYDLSRFGYHGLAFRSIARQLNTHGVVPTRTIVCHLGSGVSITALYDGASVETSMGFAPHEGVPMSTRAGDVGAGIILELARLAAVDDISVLLYTESGLRALSGYTSDMEVIVREKTEKPGAAFAFDSCIYHITRMISAHAAALGGVDLLVFSGGIGERSTEVRRAICKRLGFLGIKISEERNEFAEGEARIEHPDSAVLIRVMLPDEEGEMLSVIADSIEEDNFETKKGQR